MTKTLRVLLIASCATLGSASAWAQMGSNGPITGIPSGLGANGSVAFTPGPASQMGTESIGAPPAISGAMPTRAPRPPVGTVRMAPKMR
jgi:hypothetical protein